MRVDVGLAAGTCSYMGGIVTVPEPFVWSWTQMICFNSERLPWPVHYMRSRTTHHSTARNDMVANFVGDWLMMFDTDHWFEPDIVWRLLDRMTTHNLDVVSGIYQYKSESEGHCPVIYYFGDQSKGEPKLFRVANPWSDKTPLIRVDACGGGCLLVRRRAFEKIWDELGERPFEVNANFQGEDIAFFDRLKRVGLTAWVDTRVESNHLGWKVITRDDFDADLAGSGAKEHVTLGLGAG